MYKLLAIIAAFSAGAYGDDGDYLLAIVFLACAVILVRVDD